MNTWGISGPAFLAIYVALVAIVALAVVVARARLARPPGPVPEGRDLDRYDIAMLNGGEELAVAVALTGLCQAGAIDAGDGALRDLVADGKLKAKSLMAKSAADLGATFRVTTAEAPSAGAHPVERAVLEAAAGVSGDAAAIRSAAASSPALEDLRRNLTANGLLPGAQVIKATKRFWVWFVPVILLGLVRVIVGASRGRPVEFLVMELVATSLVMWAMSVPPKVTTAGRRAVGERQRGRSDLRRASKGRQADPSIQFALTVASPLAIDGLQQLSDQGTTCGQPPIISAAAQRHSCP